MTDETPGQGGIIHFGSEPDEPQEPKKPRSARNSRATGATEIAKLDAEPDLDALDRENTTRARAAVGLRIHGAPYEDIATTLGYTSPAIARAVVEKMLGDTSTESDWQSLRAITSRRLEGLMASLAPKALSDTKTVERIIKDEETGQDRVVQLKVENDEHLAYADRFLKVVDRHARLHGIDAPQIITTVDPSVEEFERVVGRMKEVALSGASPEADPIIMQLQEDEDGIETWGVEDEDAAAG